MRVGGGSRGGACRSRSDVTAGMASCCGAGRAWHSQNVVIFDDLQAEQDRLQVILEGLDEAQWASPSGAAGWAVTDVVLHLAQTEEAVLASATGACLALRPGARCHPG
jgi:Mycothiol maleylpyruvate isomerase N-terminal domain